MKRLALALLLLATGAAYAQSPVSVVGPITPGNCAKFSSTTIIKDAGTTCASGGGGSDTRVSLTTNTTFYVRSDGNDTTCNGTANASSASAPNCAKLTWNNLYSTVARGYDFNGFNVTLTSGTASTYANGLAMNIGRVGGGTLIIDGGGATIAETTTKGIINNATDAGFGITIQNITVSTTSGACIQNSAPSTMGIGAGLTLGNCAEADFEALQGGQIFIVATAYTVTGTGSVGSHFYAYATGAIYPISSTATFTTNRTYSVGFATALYGGVIKADGWSCSGATGCLVVGAGNTITGPRYSVSQGNIFTNAGGANFFPGTVAGSVTAGCYDTSCAAAVATLTGLGTGVATALGVNVGSAGAPLVNGGNLGTPSGGTVSLGFISGFGTGVFTALGTNVGSAGSVLVNGGNLGTPSGGTVSLGFINGFGTGVFTALGNATNGAGGFSPIDGTATLTNKTFNTGSNTFQYPASSTATSTMVCGLGTITSGATATWHYWQFGKIVYFNVTGQPVFASCTTTLGIPFPNGWVGQTYSQPAYGSSINSGAMLSGYITSGATNIALFKYDGSFPVVSNEPFAVHGSMEIQ